MVFASVIHCACCLLLEHHSAETVGEMTITRFHVQGGDRVTEVLTDSTPK